MKSLFYILIVMLALVSLPAMAQDKKAETEEPQTGPPPPLNDATTKWMVGEWTGTSESNMGKGDEWEKIQFSLDNQYILLDYTSAMTSLNKDFVNKMANQMQMREAEVEQMMKGTTYKGHGLMTLDPKTGEYIGYWFDSWRGNYTGRGKLEGKKITMMWEGTMGTSTRTIEKVSEDQLVQSFKEQDAMGNITEGKSVMMRKKEKK